MREVVSLMVANLAATMRKFANILPNGCVAEREGLILVDAGADLPMFNAAVQVEAAETVDDFDRQIAAASDFYGQRAVQWCFWACDGLLGDRPRSTAARVMSLPAWFPPQPTQACLRTNCGRPPGRCPICASAPSRAAPTGKASATL